MIRIVVAEEHAVVRWALREALAGVPDLHVVGSAATLDEALALIEAERPDLVLLDMALPDHGQVALTRLRELSRVLVLGLQSDPAHAARAMAGGAHGYVPISDSPEELLAAIRSVAHGERVVPVGVGEPFAREEPHRDLTPRELEVLELLGRGMSTREVAAHLGIKVKTVDTHRGNILEKLSLRNTSELTRYAVKFGYAPL